MHRPSPRMFQINLTSFCLVTHPCGLLIRLSSREKRIFNKSSFRNSSAALRPFFVLQFIGGSLEFARATTGTVQITIGEVSTDEGTGLRPLFSICSSAFIFQAPSGVSGPWPSKNMQPSEDIAFLRLSSI